MNALSALASGLVFGIGLWISGMAYPAKVIGFLDVFGRWDPSLAFVMSAAVLVTAVGYRAVLARPKPVFAERFDLPRSRTVDARLLAGATMFGVGWGLSGLCPGPAITGLTLGGAGTAIFVGAMLVGMRSVQLANRSPLISAELGGLRL